MHRRNSTKCPYFGTTAILEAHQSIHDYNIQILVIVSKQKRHKTQRIYTNRFRTKPHTDIMSLRRLLEQNRQTFSHEVFDNIAAIASRLIARRSASFRHQTGFKLLRKTNVALCRLHDIQLVNAIETFAGTIPDYKLTGATKQELPTRENLEFLLVRIQATAKLLLRIAQCSREAATAFLNYIHRTFFLETCTVYLGVLAEIWQMSRTLCTRVILFYNGLRPYCRHFRAGARPWLPEGYKLSANLEAFLGDAWSDECRRPDDSVATVLWQKQDGGGGDDGVGFSLGEFSNSDDACAPPVMVADKDDDYKTDSKRKVATTAPVTVKSAKKSTIVKHEFAKVELAISERPSAAADIADEIGVAISRDSFKQLVSVDKLVTVADVERFVRDAAEQHRQTGVVGKMTKMSDAEWKQLQRDCNHIMVTNQGRNCVKKFKRVWAERVRK